MVSKNEIKLIKSLSQKKHRLAEGIFIAEGVKLVTELLQSDFKVFKIYATPSFTFSNQNVDLKRITEEELHKISLLISPNEVVGLFYIPLSKIQPSEELTLILDDINDPGNLGTIIRLCDWFGVHQIICSENTVDCYNPKVVQASMGSLARVQVAYTDIVSFIKNSEYPTYATTLFGENVYSQTLPQKALLLMGNEANGIRESLLQLIQHQLTIPPFYHQSSAESLNVANATAIFLSEWRRGSLMKT